MCPCCITAAEKVYKKASSEAGLISHTETEVNVIINSDLVIVYSVV